jgi:hypothetical protein
MANITQINGSQVIDYTARDYETLLQTMYSLVPSKLPEWTDFSNQADFGNVLLELFAYMGDILSYYQDRVSNESFLGTAQTRRSVIQHLRLIGYKLGTAVPASAGLFVTVPGAVNDVVTLNRGDAFATKSQKNKPSVRFEYNSPTPLVIDFSTIVPDANGKKTFRGASTTDPVTGVLLFSGIPVAEGRLIQSEVIGTSNGSPNQHFVLSHPKLILKPSGATSQGNPDVLLLTQLGGIPSAWTQRDTLAFSRAAQPDYVIEIDEDDDATIIFGDGNFGAIPPVGAQIIATYRVGGGADGNVPAGAIQTIVGASQLALLGAQVANPTPSTGGAERESIQFAVDHAPAVFRSFKRAVTADDYVHLALSFPGVGKVQARSTGWNNVTLYVAPEGGGKVSDTLEANLKAFFEDKRMLSQIIEVADVTYIPIFVTAEIGVESYFVRSEVQANVQKAVADLLAFDNVDFGQTIYLSKFYEVAEEVPGTLFVNITEFRRGDVTAPAIEPSGRIQLASQEVPITPTDSAYAAGLRVVIVNQGGV